MFSDRRFFFLYDVYVKTFQDSEPSRLFFLFPEPYLAQDSVEEQRSLQGRRRQPQLGLQVDG